MSQRPGDNPGPPVTATENRQNLRSAERLVAGEMGVDPDDNALPYEKRLEFNRRLAEKILQYGTRFTAATKATAYAVLSRGHSPLEDATFNFSDFTSAVIDNAATVADGAAGIGDGVVTAARSARWLIPAVVILAAAIGLWAFARRTGAAR